MELERVASRFARGKGPKEFKQIQYTFVSLLKCRSMQYQKNHEKKSEKKKHIKISCQNV